MDLLSRGRTRAEFERFVSEHGKQLLRTAYLMTSDVAEAEDLVQECLLRVAKRWPKVRTMAYPRAYAHRILVNLALRKSRERTRHRHELSEHPGARFEPTETRSFGGIAQIEARDELRAALATLPARQRTMVVLRYFADLSEAQTAEALGCSLGTVKSTTSRAVDRLRTVLEAEADSASDGKAARLALGAAVLATLATAIGIGLSSIGFDGGTQRAFAGWSPTPTAPRPGQIAAAERACKSRAASSMDRTIREFRAMRLYEERHGHRSIHPLPKIGGAWRTILADTRGPYTLVLLTNGESDVKCLAGPGPSQIAGLDGQFASDSRVSVGADRIGAFSLGLARAEDGKPFKYVSGRAGTGVRTVTIVLAHGRRISATVAHGWYLAWWPGTEAKATLEVLSARGRTTLRYGRRPHRQHSGS